MAPAKTAVSSKTATSVENTKSVQRLKCSRRHYRVVMPDAVSILIGTVASHCIENNKYDDGCDYDPRRDQRNRCREVHLNAS